ncbi:class I mannose-6-phosphate isomerase [Alicyclobacillus fastidiosus]|uniref:Mannose-6-phosphate isomerase n=1 Tax=Alicyclobacillus fastidiosus TaxID=392011 RepID=A0ABY6ZJN4_9BACL|nr:type I phosphomannose isomerase catalytic subunit [Alicyclobacillus fastidiosus]WAH43051.1 class I mannose-6-phosphate isomerase [Alicyclobacillus fastidiosus]GMA65035.1 mannose-6-phosphate isomerase [Alicyclobacillus fastidiosus]
MEKFYPVKFAPVPMERIWGGHQLKPWFKEEREAPVGEYWVLSGHPNGTSIVMNGELVGKSLIELCTEYPEVYLGKSPQPRFPLLIKFLEANADLSVQIHPNDEYAQAYENDFGKTEAWYVLDCLEEGKVNYGHNFASKEEYLAAVSEKRVKDYLRFRSIKPGDVVFVPAQTLHALLAGTTVIEVQQTSDVTYRVYDWDRVDPNGSPRELHVGKAADVLIFDNDHQDSTLVEPTLVCKTDVLEHKQLVTCPYFVMESIAIRAQAYTLSPGNHGNPDVLIVAEGSGILQWTDGESISLQRGDTLLIPTTLNEYELKTENGMKVIRTYY